MADGCGPGYYLDKKTGKCRRSITTHPSRAGTFGKGFLSEPQQEEYRKIDEVERRESPELVVRQTAAMNAWTAHDRRGDIHRHAHNDLKYAEEIEKEEEPGRERKLDPPGPARSSAESAEAWDRENYRYDIEHGNLSGAEWALQRERYNGESRRKGNANRGGDRRMAIGKCGPGEEWVDGYVKEDGTRVEGYCRRKHDRLTPHDRRVDRENGEKARGSTWHKRK